MSTRCVAEDGSGKEERNGLLEDEENYQYDTIGYFEHGGPRKPMEEHKNFLGCTFRTTTRWVLTGATGLLTGLSATVIVKFTGMLVSVRELFLANMKGNEPLWFLLYNLLLALMSSFLCETLVPDAVGSGIPEVKAYLNRVCVKRLTSATLFVVKIVATVLSVSSGLMVGPFFVLFWTFTQKIRKRMIQSLPEEHHKFARLEYHMLARLVEVGCISIVTSALMFWLPFVP